MRRIFGIVTILSMAAAVAPAQDDEALRRAKADASKRAQELDREAVQVEWKTLESTLNNVVRGTVDGAVMGPAVKNAPYSAVEITETTQVLADGTRIHRENQTTVYRDSEGRVRRETPEQVTIWDPVANTSYSLDPKNQTARKLPLGATFFVGAAAEFGAGVYTYRYSTSGDAVPPPPPPPPPPPGQAAQELRVTITGRSGGGARGAVGVRSGARAAVRANGDPSTKTESLGKQLIEGVPSEGTRTSFTIEAGVIGNDRPLNIVSESWYSSELQTSVKTVHSDPRTGEEIFRLSNVSRAEPPSILFQVPSDYQLIGRK